MELASTNRARSTAPLLRQSSPVDNMDPLPPAFVSGQVVDPAVLFLPLGWPHGWDFPFGWGPKNGNIPSLEA